MAIPVSPKDDRAERKQIELLRAATPGRRAELLRSLTASVVGLSRHAILAANPGSSEREIDIRFVELHYGADLAAKLRGHLARR